MQTHAKVIWAEGILLGQQHFQAWENYIQHQQQLFLSHAHPQAWGIIDLAFDENFLAQGLLKLTRCVALTQNRDWISYDHQFDESLSLEIPEDSQKDVTVYLNLPNTNHVTGISGYPESQQPATWKGYYENRKDQYDVHREREVLLGRQNLSLSLGIKGDSPLTSIAVARLEYLPQQAAYRFSKTYIPPVLKASASYSLLSWLTGFVGLMEQQIRTLHLLKAKHRQDGSQLGYSDFIYFNLIQTLSSHMTSLVMMQRMPDFSPYKLYEQCCTLIGSFSGFLDEPFSYAQIPDYQHERLDQVFSTLHDCFVTLMAQALPTNTLDIELHRVSESEYQSGTLSEEALRHKQFCLAVYHEHLSEEMTKTIESHIKIAAPSKLHEIVQTFTPGITLKHMQAPGKRLMGKRHYHYFVIDKRSKGWEQVVCERQLAFFMNQGLLEMPVELVAFDSGAI